VNDHLLWARGKLFRPTLLLLSHRVAGGGASSSRSTRRATYRACG
jgi:geranylgeranyl pyrophosphate synthase